MPRKAIRARFRQGPNPLALVPMGTIRVRDCSRRVKGFARQTVHRKEGLGSMSKAPPTQPSLLLKLKDKKDEAAWSQFVEVYTPLIYGFARKHGVQDADASDLSQDVLRAVAGAISRFEYDPTKGTFRSWLFTIVRNKFRNFLTYKTKKQLATGGSSVQEALEAREAPVDLHEQDWRQEYDAWLKKAYDRVKPGFSERTWNAFWMVAVEGAEASAVARELGMSVGAVYIAKSRVLSHLRKEGQLLEDEGFRRGLADA